MEPRPLARPKAAQKRNKRTTGNTSDNAEQSASKRQGRCLTAELFATCARDPAERGAASAGSDTQNAQTQQQSRIMSRLLHDLTKLTADCWVVDDAKIEIQDMISETMHLQHIPATQKVLRKPSIRALYTPICGALDPNHETEQDRTHVSLTACYALQDKVLQFVQAREEIDEATKELYPFLWELKIRPHDAVLNGLPDVPKSPHELIQALKDTGASAGAPFGRLPMGAQVKTPFLEHSFYFVRMLACLELPNLRFGDLPNTSQCAELIDIVVQHRSDVAETRAAQPLSIAAGDVKDVLLEFCRTEHNRRSIA